MDQTNQPRPNLKFKQERLRHGWTHLQVANKIEMSPDTIGKWERGVDTPSLYALAKVCELFGKSAVELGFEHVSEEPGSSEEPRPLSKKERPFPPIWNVPHHENPLFTGREQILQQLHDTLLSQDAVVVTQTLSGLGGIGKTQLAVKYCHDYREKYKAVLWARADPPELLVSDLLAIAKLLKLPECKLKEQQPILNGLRRWMREQSRWLLVIDNLENMDTLKDVLPPARRGHVLITTRTQITGTFPKIALQEMQADEGALLLLRRANMLALEADPSQISESESAMARRVSQTLGGLPLALDQAGAYMQETDCGFQGYLEAYERKRSELLAYRGDGKPEHLDHPESVATTFSLCFDRVKQASTVAADILRASAFLHPDAIPEELFLKGSQELGPSFQDLSLGSVSFDRLITPLRRYSLLERNAQQKTLRVHRLVQAVLLDDMDQAIQRLWAERVIKAVNSQILFDATVDQPQQQYAVQSQACVQLIDTWNFRFVEAARLVSAAGRYRYLDGYYAQAETLCSRALALFRELPEASEEDTYVCLTSLVTIKIDHGNLLEAEALAKYLRAESEKHFGSEHVMTAFPLTYLATIYLKQELFEQAQPLLLRANRLFQSSPSPQNIPTAALLISLAKIYTHQGRSTEAETLYLEALLGSERRYGPQHPRVAEVLNELAIYYSSQKDLVKAEQMRQKALSIYTQVFPPDHPDRAITLAGLSLNAFLQRKHTDAETYYDQALAIWESKLRSERSRELSDFHTASFEDTSSVKRGAQPFLYLLENAGLDQKDVLTLSTKLAETCIQQEQYEEASNLLWYALEYAAKTLGKKDLLTVYCTGNLARFYHLRKEYDIAELLYERAIQLIGEIFRFSPPGTLQIAENYVSFLRETGKISQAVELEQSLEILKRFVP